MKMTIAKPLKVKFKEAESTPDEVIRVLNTLKSKPSRILIRYRNHEGDITKYLEATKVSYMEANGSSVKFYLTDGAMMISGKNLGTYESRVVTLFGFIKIGRSYIVNPAEIDSYNNSEGFLLLKTPLKANGMPFKIHVSKTAKQELMQALKTL